jgi:divinyl protochlorophyllide a 8-vinyl-reductase
VSAAAPTALRAGAVARIGPNAITQVAAALRSCGLAARTDELFAAAGLQHYLREPPSSMVDEREVVRLHDVLRARLTPTDCREIEHAAGVATADYLLARRIPRPVQWLLRWLPAALASRVLLAAIARHAWTFAGSGRFTVDPAAHPWSRHAVLRIADCPMCRCSRADAPSCDYYAATFGRLYRALVAPTARATEIECCARGDAACVFRVAW